MSPAAGEQPSGADLIGLGLLLAMSVIVPLVGGVLLDGALRTGPLFLLVGLVVAVLAAVGVVYTRYVRRYS